MLETLSTIPASGRLDSYGRAHPLGSLKPLNFFFIFLILRARSCEPDSVLPPLMFKKDSGHMMLPSWAWYKNEYLDSFFIYSFGSFRVRGSISFLTIRNISSIASAILFNCLVSIALSSSSAICFKFSIPSFIFPTF